MIKDTPIDNARRGFREPLPSLKVPSYLIELTYLAVLAYGSLAPALGIAIPLVGAGILGGLGILCLMHFGASSIGVFRPIKFGLGCAVFLLLIQGILHEESVRDAWMRYAITWGLGLIIIQSLSLRKGFLHRFAFVAFFIGCASLPFLKVYVVTDTMIRVGGESGVALANPNYFGMWFGFCCIYFIVMGLEARNYLVRIASWSAGILSLYLMALSVSRGSLLGVVIATVIAFQKVFKRSFLPILGILTLLWMIYITGIFDDLIGFYISRGTEETGRSRLWAWGFSGFIESWWAGVGFSNAVFPNGGYGPHNSFIFIGLSSGVVPLIFYIVYLAQASRGAIRSRTQDNPDSPYILPLVSFAMLSLMVADGTFMSPWHMVVFSAAIGATRFDRKRRRLKNKNLMDHVSKDKSEKRFS